MDAPSFHAATRIDTDGHSPSSHSPAGGSSGSGSYRVISSVKIMNQITSPGMYARKIGITQPITGPIAASSSLRHGSDTQMLNPTQNSVKVKATRNRTVGRSPEAGASRRTKPPNSPPDGSRCSRSGTPMTNHHQARLKAIPSPFPQLIPTAASVPLRER